ncbi:hypothetical protein NVP1196O_85 [Vibrio phage 1.196.O._10N.286.54.E12]|nr:hypothetical protein NVP1196O_85 [Vibrio phage 1.196.O._10N.286.54.E12]
MATPGGLVDKQELIDAQLDTAHLGRVVNSKDASGAPISTSTNRTGGVNKTLDALEGEYQSDIDNFVQVSGQVIVDKTAEFDASIANKEAEADAAIDSYRLLSKGPYAAGIELEDKFQYITYNGESYFATNPPYTTTATTPDNDGNLFISGYTTFENVANKIGNKNELSNSNFLTPSPDAITHPNATPESYVAGTQIFSGVYAGDSGCTVTFIDGRVNCTAGDYKFKLPNTGGLERIPVFTSSVSDYDGIPKTTGVSHALVGDEYVVTVTPTAGDVFSVKLEQGGVATWHEATSYNYQLLQVAIANNVSFGQVALLALGGVSGIHYFWDANTQATFRPSSPISGTITSVGSVGVTVDLVVDGNTITLYKLVKNSYLARAAGLDYQGYWSGGLTIPADSRIDNKAWWQDEIGSFVIPKSDLSFVTGATWDLDSDNWSLEPIMTLRQHWLEGGDVQAFGAIPDYYLPDGSVNPSPTDNREAIQACFDDCVDKNISMTLIGDYYYTGGLTISSRQDESNRRILNAQGALHVNLDGTGFTQALCVGDSSANGTYPLIIDGFLRIINAGTPYVGTGFEAENAAYGDYSVICSGWDIGTYNNGSIFTKYNGRGYLYSDNNLDFKITSNENPGGLRFASNLVTLEDMILNSCQKLEVNTISGLPPLTDTSGGLIRLKRVNFEGQSGVANDAVPMIQIRNAGEVVVAQVMDFIEFDNCWFEAFNANKITINQTKSKIALNNCFFARGANNDFIVHNDDKCFTSFNKTSIYLADQQPASGCIVSRNGSATDAYRSNIESINSVMYGSTGVLFPLHDGLPSNHMILSSSSSKRQVSVQLNSTYPATAVDDYMTNVEINLFNIITDFVGAGWISAEITMHSGTGASYAYSKIVATKQGAAIIYTTDNDLTLSDGRWNLKFPVVQKADFFKPQFTIDSIVNINNYPLP